MSTAAATANPFGGHAAVSTYQTGGSNNSSPHVSPPPSPPRPYTPPPASVQDTAHNLGVNVLNKSAATNQPLLSSSSNIVPDKPVAVLEVSKSAKVTGMTPCFLDGTFLKFKRKGEESGPFLMGTVIYHWNSSTKEVYNLQQLIDEKKIACIKEKNGVITSISFHQKWTAQINQNNATELLIRSVGKGGYSPKERFKGNALTDKAYGEMLKVLDPCLKAEFIQTVL